MNRNIQGFASIIFIIILTIGAVVVFIYVNNSPNTVVSIPQSQMETSNTPTPTIPASKNYGSVSDYTPPEYISFSHNGISFTYPDTLELLYKSNDVFIWRSEYTPNNYVFDSMHLRSSTSPLPSLEKGQFLVGYTNESQSYKTISYHIEQVETDIIKTETNNIVMYSINCGVDCYYHVVRFESNGFFYELVSDGAGGGLKTMFESIIGSLQLE